MQLKCNVHPGLLYSLEVNGPSLSRIPCYKTNKSKISWDQPLRLAFNNKKSELIIWFQKKIILNQLKALHILKEYI